MSLLASSDIENSAPFSPKEARSLINGAKYEWHCYKLQPARESIGSVSLYFHVTGTKAGIIVATIIHKYHQKEINNESVSTALLYWSLVGRIMAMFDLEKGKDKAGKVSTFYGSTLPAEVGPIKVSSYLFYVLFQGQLPQ